MNIRTATSTVRVGGECVGQHLERHVPIELGVSCAIHLPHPIPPSPMRADTS